MAPRRSWKKPFQLPDQLHEVVVPLYQLRLKQVDETTVQLPASQHTVALRTPEAVYDFARHFVENMDQETLIVLTVTVRHRLIHAFQMSLGALTTTMIDPSLVFRPAIVDHAWGLVLCHNHPSGDPHPSPKDRGLTRCLVEAGDLLGINVLDHIIIGDNRFVSLRDEGLVDWS